MSVWEFSNLNCVVCPWHLRWWCLPVAQLAALFWTISSYSTYLWVICCLLDTTCTYARWVSLCIAVFKFGVRFVCCLWLIYVPHPSFCIYCRIWFFGQSDTATTRQTTNYTVSTLEPLYKTVCYKIVHYKTVSHIRLFKGGPQSLYPKENVLIIKKNAHLCFFYMYNLYSKCPKILNTLIHIFWAWILFFMQLFVTILSGMANSGSGAVWSGSAPFAMAILLVH